MTSGDIKRLAKHLKISRHEFKERYTFIKDGEVRMPCPCPFYSEDINGCTVHEFRPQVCRKFPFNKTHEINGKRFVTICGDCPAGKEVAKGPVAVMPESVGVEV